MSNRERARELGRALAALRQPKERLCLRCGKPFVTVGRGKWCSEVCRVLAYRQRKQEKLVLPDAAMVRHE